MVTYNKKNLEKKITVLSNALAKLGTGTDLKELIIIIRRPGWTTPAEHIFVNGIVNGMLEHTEALGTLKETLLTGSRRVGKGQ